VVAERPADTLVICAAQVRSDLVGAGVAARLVRALVQAAESAGLPRVVAPLRPTGKHRHPLMSIEQYAAWTRPDGTAHDGWLRTHLAVGARVVATTPASQIFTAPVDSWQLWSGLSMPVSGSYLVPDALAPVLVEVESGIGTLTEPGIWVQHR
jgi:predicted GNAT family acetyltransferase